MAMFHTHIKVSTMAGIAGGAVAFVGYGVPFTTSIVGGGLCAIGGILPDIDSGPGIPLREITTFLASAVPTMLLTRLLSYNMDQEMLILTGAAIYVGIRFGLAHFLRHYTVHRGMFHSFPSMAIFGELTYLLFYGESMFVRLFMVAAVCLGFFIHLLLDEIYSVEWDGRPHVKSSFGTAMKFASNNWWANATCYGKLVVLTYFVLNDPSVVQQISAGQTQQVAQNLGQTMKNQLNIASEAVRSKTPGNRAFASFFGNSSNGSATGTKAAANVPAAVAPTVPPPELTWPAAAAPPTAVPGRYAATPDVNKPYPLPAASAPAQVQPTPPVSPTRFWQ